MTENDTFLGKMIHLKMKLYKKLNLKMIFKQYFILEMIIHSHEYGKNWSNPKMAKI